MRFCQVLSDCRLVATKLSKYHHGIKTLTVQEASERLGEWLRRAVNGEQIVIAEGSCAVLLQPLAGSKEASKTKKLSAREALSQLQSRSQLTAERAAEYLREVRAQRLAHRGRDGE